MLNGCCSGGQLDTSRQPSAAASAASSAAVAAAACFLRLLIPEQFRQASLHRELIRPDGPNRETSELALKGLSHGND